MDVKIGLSTREALTKLCEILAFEIERECELAAGLPTSRLRFAG